MTNQIKLTKKIEQIDEDNKVEMLEIRAETDHPSTEISFYMNDTHLATTMTDSNGVAIAGISYQPNQDYTFSIIINGEKEEVEYST
ncbi:hypothetical protein [uncultured Methanobrevibacter sp.]|uniref:hypothetical protein n=1 Tax=uncultured Methanobrevibacter sp. TaxID=253161 RepID=UPI0025EAAA74|nr:hypothetical protein [uncultured Methanobrevibacter sp.]